MRNALIVNKVPTPFVVELAEAVSSADSGWTLDVWFAEGLGKRGEHWLQGLDSDRVMFNLQELSTTKAATSLDELTSKKKYDAVISLLPLNFRDSSLLRKIAYSQSAKLIFWHEPPLPRNRLVMAAKKIIYRYLGRKLRFSSVWAIGHKAMTYWPAVLGAPSFLVPYYQKLTFSIEKQKSDNSESEHGKRIRFVFSGQLVERNNISEIVDAIRLLVNKGYSDSFEVLFFGDGMLREFVQKQIDDLGNDLIKLDMHTPTCWEGRLQPLRNADVLLSPIRYSGWGLTIPEAMSLGKPVISTYGSESARYFIEDGWNGYRVTPDAKSISEAMEEFIRRPQKLNDMAPLCKESAEKGGVRRGALVVIALLNYILEH